MRVTSLLLLSLLCNFAEGKGKGKVDGKDIDNEDELIDSLGIFAQDFRQKPQIKENAKKPKTFSVPFKMLKSDRFKGTALKFLHDYGYIEHVKNKSRKEMEQAGSLVDEAEFNEALKVLKKKFKLKGQLNELDEETIKYLTQARCGVSDLGKPNEESFEEEKDSSGGRARRYALSNKRWGKNALFYWLDPEKVTKDLEKDKVKEILEKAMKIWANSGDIDFYETNSEDAADIKMSFVYGDHGDGYPFTGKGGALAHAFYPKKGKLHFDDAEDFTDGVPTGTNLLYTAVHELGHILGIKHSDEFGTIMFPYYPGYSDTIELKKDDLNALDIAIGLGTGEVYPLGDNSDGTPATVEPPTVLPDTPPTCWDRIDGVLKLSLQDVHVYVFSGHWYFKLRPQNPDGRNYLPVYDESVAPKLIKEGFNGVPSNIDGVVAGIRGESNFVYFFKDDRVYKYSLVERKVVKTVSLSEFLGLPTEAPSHLITAYKLKSYRNAFQAENGVYVYDDYTGEVSGPIKAQFDTEDRQVDAISQTFYGGWTWVFQGNYYGVAKTRDGTYSPGRTLRPIKTDIKIPMCSEAVGELTTEQLATCEAELRKLKRKNRRKSKGASSYTPSEFCTQYIEDNLKPVKPLSSV